MSLTPEKQKEIAEEVRRRLPPGTAFCMFFHTSESPDAQLMTNMEGDSLRNFVMNAIASFCAADMKGEVVKEPEAR